jgi:hypothetical protein
MAVKDELRWPTVGLDRQPEHVERHRYRPARPGSVNGCRYATA